MTRRGRAATRFYEAKEKLAANSVVLVIDSVGEIGRVTRDMTKPRGIAAIATFVASRAADVITCANFLVNGGQHMFRARSLRHMSVEKPRADHLALSFLIP